MPDSQDTTGAKVPPVYRTQCPQCRAMNMPETRNCVNCDYLLRGGPNAPYPER